MPTSKVLRPDLLIVGGGIAGSALATVMARAGHDVHLVEREPAFRDRIRGETIHPWGASEARELGLYEDILQGARALEQVLWQRYVDSEAQEPYRWADDFPNAPNGLGVSHVALQNMMLCAAVDAGVTVHRPATVRFDGDPGSTPISIVSGTDSLRVAPRLLVGADGERSATRTALGGESSADVPHHQLGGALIGGLDLAPDRIHQAFFEGGFVFASPLADNVARLYLVCSTDEATCIRRAPDPASIFVQRFRESTPAGMLGEAWESLGPVGFFPNNGTVVSMPTDRAAVLIGDAAGRNDPSQGHGLSLAFHDVRHLRDLLVSNRDWTAVPAAFASLQATYRETLRQHALWTARQATETGPEIDAIKDRIARARELDPTAGGFAAIFAIGPDGLAATDESRRHFLGEDLVG